MAIEFRTAITIGGVNVAPGYPALSGLTAGMMLRASSGTVVAFAALIANDLPATLNASGIRAARGANADGLWVAWQSGDTNSTFHAGGGSSSNNMIAVYGESYSSEGIRGASTTGIPILAIKSDTTTNASSSGLRVSHRSSGVIAAGLGIEINFMLQSSTTPDMEVARVSGVWTDPTHISRAGDLTFGTTLAATTAEKMRLTSGGALWIGRTTGGLSGGGDLDVVGNVAIGGTFSLPNKTANFVYAGPTSGGAAVPAFRALVAADMPATAVAAGVYTNANITVDAAGHLTSAATGAVVSIPTSVVGYLPFYATTTTLTSEANLFWDATNDRLGIGTVAPAYNLDVNWSVNSAAQAVALRNSNTGSAAYTPLHMGNNTDANGAGLYRQSSANTGYAGANSLMLFTVGAHPIGIVTNNVLRMLFDSSGNVGIGTTSNAAKLHVYDAAAATVDIQSDPTTGYARLRLVASSRTFGFITEGSAGTSVPGALGLYDYTAGAFRLAVGSTGFVGINTLAPNAQLEVVRGQAVQLRLSSGAGTGTTFMAYSVGNEESLYLMVNRTYSAGAFSRINSSYGAWTLSMGTQDADSFKIYRETNAGVQSTLFQIDSSGNVTTPKGGTIRADEATYAAPGAGQGLEIASTSGQGYVQSYNRSTSAWRPININGSVINFGGGVAASSVNSTGDFIANRYFFPGNQTTHYFGLWAGNGVFANNHLLVQGAMFPGGQGSYYVNYCASPAGILVVGNLSCNYDIYPGNNNGTAASQNTSYYLRGETNNGGLRTNGNFLVSGYVATLYNWNTGGLGTNQFVGYCSSGLQTTVFSGLGGYSYTAGGIGYNWGNINGGASGQLTGSNGGGYIRWHQDGQFHLGIMNTSATVNVVMYAGLNNIGIGVGQGTSTRLIVQGTDTASSSTTLLCRKSDTTQTMYVRNDGFTFAYQAWTLSDGRMKRQVRATDRGLQHIMQLGVKRYTKVGIENEEHGMVAQELQLVMPELVSDANANEGGETLLAVNYNSLTSVLVRAVQELSEQVAAQGKEIAALRKRT